MTALLALHIFIKEIATIVAAVCAAVTIGRLLVMLPDLPWWARALMGIGIGFCGVAVAFAMTSARRKAVLARRPAARLQVRRPAPPPPAPPAPAPQVPPMDIELQPLPHVAVPSGRVCAPNSDEDEHHEDLE